MEYTCDKSKRTTGDSRTVLGATFAGTYVYDALGQLSSFAHRDGYEEGYAHDPGISVSIREQHLVAFKLDAGELGKFRH